MSLEAITWALDQDCASGSEQSVLFVIANYAHSDGTCYPGHETIAKKASVSVKTVERALQAFEERGWLKREERRRRDGSRTSDLLELICAPSPERRDQSDIVSGSRPATRHPVQANQTPCPKSPDTMSGPTTFEPKGNTKGETKAPSAAAAPTSENEGKAAPSKGKRTSIPDGFPSESDLAEYFDRYDAAAVRRQAELFRNHALQEGRAVVDWRPALSNWLLSADLPPAGQGAAPTAFPVSSLALRLVSEEKGKDFAAKWLFGAAVDDGAQRITVISRLAADALGSVQALAGWTIIKWGDA